MGKLKRLQMKPEDFGITEVKKLHYDDPEYIGLLLAGTVQTQINGVIDGINLIGEFGDALFGGFFK